MKLLINKVLEVLQENVEKKYDVKLTQLDIQNSTKKEFGDFQSNFAMTNSKKLGLNPRQIAQDLIENFDGKGIVRKLEVAGPGFINIFVEEKLINEYCSKLEKEKYEYGVDNTRIVAIDYSSPNIAKRMHVGHLRSTIIGDSLKRIYQEIGFKVLGDNHIGDWGTQFGKLIVAYNKWLNRKEYEKDAVEELERLYVKFSNEAKQDPSLEEQAREELRKVQTGDPVNLALWKEFIEYSMKEYEKVYNKLDIKFELVNGESFYNEMMPGVLETLKEKNIAKQDNEALVVFFDEKDNLPPCIVQKKDGSFLYSTSDLATIMYRKDELDVSIALYVVDERQQGHFKQVFKIAEMMGKPYDYEKHHTYFGIMRFSDGLIFSSRGGNVIHLIDLINQATKEVKKVVAEKNPDLSEKEQDEISETIGVGAIKYFDLSQNRTSPIVFDWAKVLSFEGNTGPYLQYTYVRINSILNKVDSDLDYVSADVLNEKSTEAERDLAMTMLKYPTAVLKAYETNRPNVIADYIYDLAKKFNSFYNSEKILSNDDKELVKSRVLLSAKVAYVLKSGLQLLGIKTVNKM